MRVELPFIRFAGSGPTCSSLREAAPRARQRHSGLERARILTAAAAVPSYRGTGDGCFRAVRRSPRACGTLFRIRSTSCVRQVQLDPIILEPDLVQRRG